MHTHDPQNLVCFFKQVLSKEGASNFVKEDRFESHENI